MLLDVILLVLATIGVGSFFTLDLIDKESGDWLAAFLSRALLLPVVVGGCSGLYLLGRLTGIAS